MKFGSKVKVARKVIKKTLRQFPLLKKRGRSVRSDYKEKRFLQQNKFVFSRRKPIWAVY